MKTRKWPPNDALAKLLRLQAKLHRGATTPAQFEERRARLLAAKSVVKPIHSRERTR
jgi:hypothetical protein